MYNIIHVRVRHGVRVSGGAPRRAWQHSSFPPPRLGHAQRARAARVCSRTARAARRAMATPNIEGPTKGIHCNVSMMWVWFGFVCGENRTRAERN